MRSTWKKLVSMWNERRGLVVCLAFCFVIIGGATLYFSPAIANTGATPGTTGAVTEPPGSSGLDFIMNGIAGIADAIFTAAWQLVILMIQGLISIISYDSFSNNAVIKIGWPIVRNAINMFVILGLLAIAIKNLIPGQSNNAQAQSQLFKMLLAVVLMNFSQTITLLLVDFSQVVTITFAQAISEIGSGNFIQLFGLQNHLALKSGAEEDIIQGASQGALLFGTALFKLVMVGATAIAIAVMILALLLRIIMLWFLIILSPAAFFAFGIGDVVPMAKNVWTQWSSRFMGLLAFGPALVFFLWLSLSIAASGDIASTVGFSVSNDGASGSLLASAEPASFLSTIVAIVMIFIGVGVSAQIASAAEGVGDIMGKGKDLTRGFIKRYSKKAAIGTLAGATAGAGVGAVTGGAAAIGLTGASTAGSFALGAGQAVGAAGTLYGANKVVAKGPEWAKSGVRAVDRGAGYLQGVPVVGGVLNQLGLAELREGTSAAAKALGGVEDGRRRAADDWVKNRDSKSLQTDLEQARATINNPMAGPEEIARARAVMQKLVTDKDFEKKYRDDRGAAAADEMTRQAIAQMEADKFDHIEDEAEKKKAKENFLKFKARNLHVLDEDARREVLNDADFKKSMLSEKALFQDVVDENGNVVRDAAGKAVQEARPDVWDTLRGQQEVVRYDNEGNPVMQSMARQVRDGRGGTKALAAKLRDVHGNDPERMRNLVEGEAPIGPQFGPPEMTPEQRRAAFAAGVARAEEINEAIGGEYQDEIIEGVVSQGAAFNASGLNDDARDQIRERINEESEELEGEIAELRDNGLRPSEAQLNRVANLRGARFNLGVVGGGGRPAGVGAEDGTGIDAFLTSDGSGNFIDDRARNDFVEMMSQDVTRAADIDRTRIRNNDLALQMASVFTDRRDAIADQVREARESGSQEAIRRMTEALEAYQASSRSGALEAAEAREMNAQIRQWRQFLNRPL